LFIVLYGTNGVGKTTQAKLLADWLSELRYEVQQIKFPLYGLPPTGPRIDRYIHGDGNGGTVNPENISVKEFQELCAENRRDGAGLIEDWLADGCIVIAEDWTYGGIVWGMATGVPKKAAYAMNTDFIREDAKILIDALPFTKEERHIHEEDSALVARVRNLYIDIARAEGWPIVNGNQDRIIVHSQITDIVRPFFK